MKTSLYNLTSYFDSRSSEVIPFEQLLNGRWIRITQSGSLLFEICKFLQRVGGIRLRVVLALQRAPLTNVCSELSASDFLFYWRAIGSLNPERSASDFVSVQSLAELACAGRFDQLTCQSVFAVLVGQLA
jgi:hypothetical protein